MFYTQSHLLFMNFVFLWLQNSFPSRFEFFLLFFRGGVVEVVQQTWCTSEEMM